MANCYTCGGEYSNKRKKLGYNICLSCGEAVAYKDAVIKSNRIAPVYNKGPYQLITDGMMKDKFTLTRSRSNG